MNKTLIRGLIIILLIPYSLLLFEFLAKDVTLKNIIKVFAAVAGPLPLAIFIAYILVSIKNVENTPGEVPVSALASFNYLLITLFIAIIFLYVFEAFIYKDFSQTVAPIFFNSFVIVMYLVNLLFTKNLQMIAILSGISMGISLYVLFLS